MVSPIARAGRAARTIDTDALAERAAALSARKRQRDRQTDVTLPPRTREGDPGAGPVTDLPARRRSLAKSEVDRQRDGFWSLKASARRAERAKGSESRFAKYFASERRKQKEIEGSVEDIPPEVLEQEMRESVGVGMKAGGLTRDQKKTIKERSKLAKKRSRDAQKKRRKSIASTTPKIRGTTMTVAKGGVVSHTDYRKGGLFYKGKK